MLACIVLIGLGVWLLHDSARRHLEFWEDRKREADEQQAGE
jgi:hypothetical protein